MHLINDVLEMSRIESNALEIEESPVDILMLIKNVKQMSETLALSKSIDFATEIGVIRNPYVLADELHVNEVMINLISNAIKYTPDGGKVRFIVEQISDDANGKTKFSFTIKDNGIGMSEEFQKHLFEAFARERTSTVSKQQGAGLGLSIVKRIVDLSGGTIDVKSKTGEGSTFTVELTFRAMSEEEIVQFKNSKEFIAVHSMEYTFEDMKILLAEDNEMNREIAVEILEDAGATVDSVEDGEFAVKAVMDKGVDYYDFILMDIQMPFMDGYTATKEIRKLPGGDAVTIIALSANAFDEDIKKSLASGMNAHVAKPIDINKLFETMQEFF